MLHRPTMQAPRGVWFVVAAALTLPALLQMFTGHEGLEPRGEALGWNALLITIHILADLSTALSYIAIAAMLGFLAVKARSGLPFMWTFVAFGVFSIACGFTHAVAVATVYTPLYWLSGGVKVVTAIASVGTALVLPPLLPRVLTMVESSRLSEERRQQIVEANRELAAAPEQLRELNQLKSQFFANVSHELRTPLTLILGPVRKLQSSGALSEGQRRDLEVVDRNARILLKHVNDLLDASKLEAGKMAVEYAEVDLARQVTLAASYFETLAAERQISYSINTPQSLPAQVDPEKLQRVLLNLLSNAFKFTPDGGSVNLSLRVEGELGLIEVADSGPGVEPELREAVFERFRQGEGGSTRRFGGTGLGLAIAREFVELHSGEISVGDAPQGGARFLIELPLTAPEDVELRRGGVMPAPSEEITLQPLEGSRPATETMAAATTEDGAPLVLVVEDNPEMNRFVTETLAGEYRVASALDGREGVDKALELGPDLILSDVMMPELSGDELVHEVRTHPELESVPIVLLTARTDDELRVRMLREGAQDYLTKPFSAAEVRARAGNLIAMKQVRDVLRAELETTERDVGKLAGQLAERKREVERALEMRNQFLSIASHELKTPITMIKGPVQLLSMRLPEAVRTEYNLDRPLQILERNVDRTARLIEDLLDVSRIETGQLDLRTEEFELVEGVEVVVDEMAETQPQFEFSFDASQCPLSVHADRARIRQVVQNLLANGVRYSDGKGRVEVSVGAAGTEAMVVVRDYGIGVPEEQRERIFEMYSRADNADENYGGLGLGLFISRNIVERHGGRIWVEDADGRGSSFRFTLPAVDGKGQRL